jgi:hypothetical protein
MFAMDSEQMRRFEWLVIGLIMVGLAALGAGMKLATDARSSTTAVKGLPQTVPVNSAPNKAMATSIASVALPTEPAYPVPSHNTATPDPATVAANLAYSAGTIFPTPTPLVVSKVTDLSPELAEKDKYIVIVVHSDGSHEEFILGPVSKDPSDGRILSIYAAKDPEILPQLNLKEGDQILGSWSIAEMNVSPLPAPQGDLAKTLSPQDQNNPGSATKAPMRSFPPPGGPYP